MLTEDQEYILGDDFERTYSQQELVDQIKRFAVKGGSLKGAAVTMSLIPMLVLIMDSFQDSNNDLKMHTLCLHAHGEKIADLEAEAKQLKRLFFVLVAVQFLAALVAVAASKGWSF